MQKESESQTVPNRLRKVDTEPQTQTVKDRNTLDKRRRRICIIVKHIKIQRRTWINLFSLSGRLIWVKGLGLARDQLNLRLLRATFMLSRTFLFDERAW